MGSDRHFIVLSFRMSVENRLCEEWEGLLAGLIQGHVQHLGLETMVVGPGRDWQRAPRAAQTRMYLKQSSTE